MCCGVLWFGCVRFWNAQGRRRHRLKRNFLNTALHVVLLVIFWPLWLVIFQWTNADFIVHIKCCVFSWKFIPNDQINTDTIFITSLPFQTIEFQDIAWDISIDAEAKKKNQNFCYFKKTANQSIDNKNIQIKSLHHWNGSNAL